MIRFNMKQEQLLFIESFYIKVTVNGGVEWWSETNTFTAECHEQTADFRDVQIDDVT